MTFWTARDYYGQTMTTYGLPDRDLNAVIDFDSPFTVTNEGDGTVTVLDYDPNTPYVPEVTNSDTGDVTIDSDDWEALTGWTGQYGYHGAVMHPSEYLGGSLAAHVLNTPGTYVVTEVRDTDGDFPDDDPIGWVVLRLK